MANKVSNPDSEIICKCLEISKGDLKKAILSKGLTCIEDVQDSTEAGTGCGSCIDEIEELLVKTNK